VSIPERVAIVGAGEIGAGWAALFAAHGAEVRLFDPDHDAQRRARAALTDAVRCGVGAAHLGSIDQYVDLDDAVRDAVWVQESLPERLDLKRAMLGAVERVLHSQAIVASSTSSHTPAELFEGRAAAARMLVAHPLHPVYAVPIVELCAGPATAPAAVGRAAATMRALGREPVVVARAVPGLVATRLTAALLREAFALVADGVVGAEALDAVVRRGLAPGWAAAGALGTEAIGAGGSFAAFVERLGEPLGRIWASLAAWSELSPERRAALLDAARGLEASSRAHGSGDPAWAETLARISRAADGSPDPA
jgi:3-hydroxyacyl-CoA dehydrogenase